MIGVICNVCCQTFSRLLKFNRTTVVFIFTFTRRQLQSMRGKKKEEEKRSMLYNFEQEHESLKLIVSEGISLLIRNKDKRK